MVEEALNQQLIDAGAEIVRKLDEKGLGPDAAFWLFLPESQSWRLILAEAQLGKSGPKDVYRQIQRIMKDIPESKDLVELADIGLMRSDAPFIELLRSAVRTGPNISGIRFTNNVVNGNLIEDAYIYRVA